MKNNEVIVLILVAGVILIGFNFTGLATKETVPREVTILIKEWEFFPKEIKVKYNEDVRLRLENDGNRTFGFKLSRYMYNQNIKVNSSEVKNFDFRAHTKGQFIYRCEDPCGWGENFMKGVLIVE